MQMKLISEFPCENDKSDAFPVCKMASVIIKGIVSVPHGVAYSGNFKIMRDGNETHNVNIADLVEFNDMEEGKPEYNVVQDNLVDVITFSVRIPFQSDGCKALLRNALDVSKCNDTQYLFTHGNGSAHGEAGSRIRLYFEPTIHNEVFRPYFLPFSTSATAGMQPIQVTKKNVEKIYIKPVEALDIIDLCKNGQNVCHVYGSEVLSFSALYWNIEETTTDLTWGMFNLIPSGLEQELKGNRVQLEILQTTAVSTKIYAIGFESLDNITTGCGCH